MEEFTLERLAELICGDDDSFVSNNDDTGLFSFDDDTGLSSFFSGQIYLDKFFETAGLPRFQPNYSLRRNRNDKKTLQKYVLLCLKICSNEELNQVILGLASLKLYRGNVEQLELALRKLNEILSPEGLSVEMNGIKPVLNSVEPRLSRYQPSSSVNSTFLLEKPNFKSLGIEAEYSDLLDSRWLEVEKCLQSHAYLASIILMGSLLEGVLYWALAKFPEKAFRASASPKDPKTGKPKSLHDWSLSQMIDVAHEIGWLGIDVKRFSHSVREFRNLVHPYQQLKEGAIPDDDTCKISWQVVRASLNDLEKHFAPLYKNGS